MDYRWNYGNGQVGPTRENSRAAERDGIPNEPPVGFVEWREPETGDWIVLIRRQGRRS